LKVVFVSIKPLALYFVSSICGVYWVSSLQTRLTTRAPFAWVFGSL